MKRHATRPASPLASLALCGLLVASGCNGSEEPGTTSQGENELAANARAAAINVSLSDLPEGFTAVSRTDGEEEQGAPIEDCVEGVGDARVTNAGSPIFRIQTDTTLSFVLSETSLLSDPDEGARLIDSVAEQPVLDCLSDRLGDVFFPDATTETALVLTADPQFPDLAERGLRLAGSATYAREGAPAPITITTSLVFLQTGDALSVLVFGGIIEPFAADTARALAIAVAERQRT